MGAYSESGHAHICVYFIYELPIYGAIKRLVTKGNIKF